MEIYYHDLCLMLVDRIAELKYIIGKDDITYKARIEELLHINKEIDKLHREAISKGDKYGT